MRPLVPYLFFNGNCREAMQFYQACFGGQLNLINYSEAPAGSMEMTPDANAIMHAYLKNDAFTLMASDWPGNEAKRGNDIHLNIDCSSLEEIESIFQQLSQEGKVIQPLSATFWAEKFGMLVDQYGIHWMLNYAVKQ